MSNKKRSDRIKHILTDVSYRAQAGVIRGVLGILGLLPYKVRVRLGGWFVRRVVGPLAGYPTRIGNNLNLIFPDLTPSDHAKLIPEICTNIGITITELFSVQDIVDRLDAFDVYGEGLAALEAAKQNGQPAIIVSGHFANYDVVRGRLVKSGFRVGGLYQRMRNPYFHDYYLASISKMGLPLFERGRPGLKDMLSFLKGGGVLALLNDQHMGHGPILDFMGKPAKTALSAAEMALKYNAILMPVYSVRQRDLSYKIYMEAPIPHTTAEDMTQKLNDSLSDRIRENPEQWLWSHRRWKGVSTNTP